ncbi:MAG: hypothetical protein RL522_107 [Pseudomonadota bacterium]|jgi:tripartite-type tricarboxylate transporter receptor subunit TctC
MKRRTLLGATLLLPVASTVRAQAQAASWPQRPVKWILSQPAGSGPDIIARYVAEQLSKLWSQAVVIENRPGGQNVIGAQAAARSAPDGYTFYFATTAAMVTNAFTFKTLPYDPVKDFAPVRLVGRSPFVIAAGPGFAARDLADAFAQAKAQPGKIAIATEGPKTFSGILADAVADLAGAKLNHVPYTKAPDALQDLVGGRVQMICLPEAALISYVRSGQIRALAVSTGQRIAALPSTPTLSETFSGFEFAGWNALFAPAGTSPEVLARLARDLETVLRQPETTQRLLSLGSIPEPQMTVAGFDAFMRAERERWARVVKALNIQAE